MHLLPVLTWRRKTHRLYVMTKLHWSVKFQHSNVIIIGVTVEVFVLPVISQRSDYYLRCSVFWISIMVAQNNSDFIYAKTMKVEFNEIDQNKRYKKRDDLKLKLTPLHNVQLLSNAFYWSNLLRSKICLRSSIQQAMEIREFWLCYRLQLLLFCCLHRMLESRPVNNINSKMFLSNQVLPQSHVFLNRFLSR